MLANVLRDLLPNAVDQDSLIGGSGDVQFYGNPHGATFMGGGTGDDTFYNCVNQSADTIVGGSGKNTLMFQGIDPSGDTSGLKTSTASVTTRSPTR